jgi:hypothetical protein
MADGFRMVYASTNYDPDDVMKRYGKVNCMQEGGYRVVEANAKNQTIREFVTQHESYFEKGKVEEMKQISESGVTPSWVEL